MFALAGRVVNTGLVEVPMGTTLREIVFDIGGGIVDGRAFKAVQTGGPAGGCIPAQFLDMPVDYESLMGVGSFMGSGGMIVMDETSCMVNVARYFMDFCREESCGKCVPCRVGTTQLWMLLDRISSGQATMDDLAQMERLAGMVQRTSLCGLGQGAPNPDLQHAALLPRRVPRPHRRPGLSRRRLRDRGSRRCPHDASTRCGSTAPTWPGTTASRSSRSPPRTASTSPRCAISTGCPTRGSCRLCVVEIAGSAKLAPACTTAVAEGMDVTTTSEQLTEYRRTITEMMFLERNHICAVCVANNHCELQDLAEDLQVDHFELPVINPSVGIDASHPLFAIDHNRCIMCVRCVRVCGEIEGAHTWGVMRLGHRRAGGDRHGHAVGRVDDLHQLRQVRPGLPHGRALREGPLHRRGEQGAAAVPAVPAGRSARTRASHDQAHGSPRSGSTAAPAATCRSWTWTSACSRSPSARTSSTARSSTSKEYPTDVDFCLVEGAVSSEEDLHKIQLVRERTRTLVSFGDCAVTANVPGMRNPIGVDAAAGACLRRERDAQPGHPARGGAGPAADGPAGPSRRQGRRLPARLSAVGRPHLPRARRPARGTRRRTPRAPGSAAEETP